MPRADAGLLRKALLWGAFCVWAFSATEALAEVCTGDRRDLLGTVREVVDGDTVVLADGRSVRFIGINTPERSRDERPAEPLADDAHAALVTRLAAVGNRLALRFDEEREDRYGRLLAHPFYPNGDSVTVDLLRQGFGMAIAVSPNLAYQDCYRAAEREARRTMRGVWALPHYQARDAAALDASATGFQRIRGRLDHIGFSRDTLWLQIGPLGIRIHKDHLAHFRRWNFHALQGREMIVRGWVVWRKGRPRLNLTHPNDLELPDTEQAR